MAGLCVIAYPMFAAALDGSIWIGSSFGTISYDPLNNAPALHVEGKEIKDADGNTVVLRGVNRGHFHASPDGWWGEFSIYDEGEMNQELDIMASWGINVVRLYTAIRFWLENSPASLEGGGTLPHRDVVKKVIEAADARGIYIVYCPWSVRGGTDESYSAPFPYPPRSTHPEIIGSIAEFVAFWNGVSAELGQYDNVIFELWNEPGMNIPGGATPEETQEWFDVTQQCIDQIRQTRENIVVASWVSVYYDNSHGSVETTDWIYRYPLTGTNLIYSTHLYTESFGYNPYSTTYDQVLNAMIKEKINISDKPMWIGEIGCSLSNGDDELNRFRWALQILNSWSIGYAGWDWRDDNTWALVQNYWGNNPSPPMCTPTASGQILKDAIAVAL